LAQIDINLRQFHFMFSPSRKPFIRRQFSRDRKKVPCRDGNIFGEFFPDLIDG
jgi:hypothetical protein